MVRGGERPMGRMMAIGMQHVYWNEYHTVDEELEKFAEVTRKNVRDVLKSYPLDQATTFALGPLTRLRRPK